MTHPQFKSTTNSKNVIDNYSKSTLKFLRIGSSLLYISKVSLMSVSSTNRNLRYFLSLKVLSMIKFLRNSQSRRPRIQLAQILISRWKSPCHQVLLNLPNSNKVFNLVLTKDNRWWTQWMQFRRIVSLINNSRNRWVWRFQPIQVTSLSTNLISSINNSSSSSKFTKW